MAASNSQVQSWSDQRTRVRAEQIRKLYLLCKDDIASFQDIYDNLTNSPTWTDGRIDAPPNLMTPSDLLAVNTVVNGFVKWVEGTFSDLTDAHASSGQYPVVLEACVRPPEIN